MGSTARGAALALAGLLVLVGGSASCTRSLYTFPKLPKDLPQGEANLLSDPSFEDPTVQVCSLHCTASSGWSIEHTTAIGATVTSTTEGVVTGALAEGLSYSGSPSDNGLHKDIELYQARVGTATTAGHLLTFTLWVSGTCTHCAPFVGIEAFDEKSQYLGESDQYFDPPATPRPVQVSYVLPSGAAMAAVFIQVPEIYSISRVDLYVDNASLTSQEEESSLVPSQSGH